MEVLEVYWSGGRVCLRVRATMSGAEHSHEFEGEVVALAPGDVTDLVDALDALTCRWTPEELGRAQRLGTVDRLP